jgi:hypothetical protein
MRKDRPRGILNLSIDIQPEADVSALCELLATYSMPATWALADVGSAEVVGRILARQADSELAPLVGESLVNDVDATKSHVLDSLADTLRAKRRTISTVCLAAIGAVPSDQKCLVMMRQGIMAVRDPAALANPLQPTRRRFGLWRLPVSYQLPGGSRWKPGGGGGKGACAIIDEAITTRSIAHVAIEAARFNEAGRGAIRVLARVLQHAQMRRQAGALDVLTAADTVAGLNRGNQGQPSQSILRPAA